MNGREEWREVQAALLSLNQGFEPVFCHNLGAPQEEWHHALLVLYRGALQVSWDEYSRERWTFSISVS